MKKTIVILLIILVFAGIAGWGAMAALASPKNIPMPKAEIISAEGEVLVQTAGSNEWRNLTIGEEIKNSDKVKTGKDGQAVFNFFNGSTARIDANSEIIIDNLYLNQKNYAESNASITVTVGRMWSRILQLTDSKANFEVKSSNAVATVRGTGFDFLVNKDGSTEINTTENSVDVSLLEGENSKKAIKLPRGKGARISKTDGKKLELVATATPKELKDSRWFKNNLNDDDEFIKNIKELNKEINREAAGILPDSPLYKLKIAAEKSRIMFASREEEQKLKADFLASRLAETQALLDAGKSGLAETILGSAVRAAQGQLEKGGDQGNLPNLIWLQKQILKDVLPGQSGSGLKITIDDIRFDLAGSEEEKNYLLYKRAEDRLKEAEAFEKLGEKNLAAEQMLEYQKLIEQIKQAGSLEADDRTKTLESIRESLFQGAEEPAATEEAKTIEPAEIKLLDQTPDEAKPSQAEPVFREPLLPQRTPLEPIKEPVAEPSIIKEPLTVEPVIEEPVIEEPKVEPVVLTSLKVAPVSGNNMPSNATKQFTAIAVYSDGSTKAATELSVWSLSGDIGTISSSGVLTSDADGGNGVVTASFTENGITVTGSSATITALTMEM